MHWLFDLVIDLLFWLIPWGSKHDDRSIVGESRFDRQARRVTWILIVLVALGLIVWYFLLE